MNTKIKIIILLGSIQLLGVRADYVGEGQKGIHKSLTEGDTATTGTTAGAGVVDAGKPNAPAEEAVVMTRPQTPTEIPQAPAANPAPALPQEVKSAPKPAPVSGSLAIVENLGKPEKTDVEQVTKPYFAPVADSAAKPKPQDRLVNSGVGGNGKPDIGGESIRNTAAQDLQMGGTAFKVVSYNPKTKMAKLISDNGKSVDFVVEPDRELKPELTNTKDPNVTLVGVHGGAGVSAIRKYMVGIPNVSLSALGVTAATAGKYFTAVGQSVPETLGDVLGEWGVYCGGKTNSLTAGQMCKLVSGGGGAQNKTLSNNRPPGT